MISRDYVYPYLVFTVRLLNLFLWQFKALSQREVVSPTFLKVASLTFLKVVVKTLTERFASCPLKISNGDNGLTTTCKINMAPLQG